MSIVQQADPRWYLVQTAMRSERRVALRLGWAGYAIALPLIAEPAYDRLRRITHTRQVAAFPGYVMVSIDLDREPLHPVLKCEGVKRMFLNASGRPLPIRRGEVERLMDEADGRRSLAQLAEGSRVRLTAGPFANAEGVCLWKAADRVGLLMELLGGQHQVTVPRDAVQVVQGA